MNAVETLYRITKVVERIGVSKSTIWQWVKEGKFPNPIKLSPKITVWKSSEIDIWIASQGGES